MDNFWNAKRILITGGAGFIGSSLLEPLLQLGAEIRVVDNLERGKIEYIKKHLDSVEFRNEDLCDPDTCKRACEDIDIVFHLASKVGGIKYYLAKPAEVFSEGINIDYSMWQAAIGAGVPFYLYASSAHVYPIELQGSPDAPLISENQCYPANPELSYGWGKLVGEKLIEYAIKEGCKTRAAIVRIIGAFGPNQDIELETGSAIPVFIHRAIYYPRRQPFVVLGTGKETRSYCYIDDIVEGLFRATKKLESHSLVGPFNLGSEERISIGDLVNEVINISGKDIEIEWDLSNPTVIWGQALDCNLARELLDGWEPKITIREGLERCYKHILDRLDQQQDEPGSV